MKGLSKESISGLKRICTDNTPNKKLIKIDEVSPHDLEAFGQHMQTDN
jgi:hypothetical protein